MCRASQFFKLWKIFLSAYPVEEYFFEKQWISVVKYVQMGKRMVSSTVLGKLYIHKQKNKTEHLPYSTCKK